MQRGLLVLERGHRRISSEASGVVQAEYGAAPDFLRKRTTCARHAKQLTLGPVSHCRCLLSRRHAGRV